MSAYRRHFHKTKYMFFLIKEDQLLEKYNEIREKFNRRIKKNLIVNLYIMKNIWKLKDNLTREKPIQIFTIIKDQKKILNLFVYQ